jgi:hypothetical protein
MSRTRVHLDLDRLVEEYLENLNVTLRGFKAAEEFDFLQSWVPSDDPTDSVIDLVELARDAQVPRLTIGVREETLARIDAGRIQARVGPFERRADAGKTALEFALAAEALPIHSCYQAALTRLLERVTHEGALAPSQGKELVSVSADGMTLAALVEPRRHVVAQAAFQGASAAVQRGLLEGLCAAMEGRPLQDAADHALIAVEDNLRDHAQPPPVSGLVTPDNADPAFAGPQQLVRALLAAYRERTGWRDTANFHDAPVSSAWAALTPAERSSALGRALEALAVTDRVEVVGLEGPKRVVVRFLTDLSSDARQTLLRQLENQLRQAVEPTLHVVAQVKSDVNILRQPDRKKPASP